MRPTPPLNAPHPLKFVLEPADSGRLARLCGPLHEHVRLIEERLGVEILNRGSQFVINGPPGASVLAQLVLRDLYQQTAAGTEFSDEHIHLCLIQASNGENPDGADSTGSGIAALAGVRTRRTLVKPRGKSQWHYVRSIDQFDISFGIGPAGTGKTYLAVACAVAALDSEQVRRIVLVRPAVEAGERLGFLPGDLAQKIDPYLRPLYDALYEMLGFDTVYKLIERNIIEVAPLAYMRGRTLNHAFIILDEAQNTSAEQMKMFLTRIGFGSKAVITGDITQTDLPRGTLSGLAQVVKFLDTVEGIGFNWFSTKDVVRHPLVQRIVEAYEAFESPEALPRPAPRRNETTS